MNVMSMNISMIALKHEGMMIDLKHDFKLNHDR